MLGEVMKTGWRRSLRIPVSARAVSSRCTFSARLFRLTTLRSWRRSIASGRDTRPAAFKSRLRSGSAISARTERSATISSRSSAAARKRSIGELRGVCCVRGREDAVFGCMLSIYPESRARWAIELDLREPQLLDQRWVARITSDRVQAWMDPQQDQSRRVLLDCDVEPLERVVDISETRVQHRDSPCRDNARGAARCE